jgi:hypothetical protein
MRSTLLLCASLALVPAAAFAQDANPSTVPAASPQTPVTSSSAAGSPAEQAKPTSFEHFDVSTWYTHGNYGKGASSDSTATYGQYYFSPVSKLYLGHSSIGYRANGAFFDGQHQFIDNVGTYLEVTKNDFVQLDYVRVSDNKTTGGKLGAFEYQHALDSKLLAGIGYSNAQYPGYGVTQYVPRLLWWATPAVSLNSRVYFTNTTFGPARMAFSENVAWYPDPRWKLKLGASTGSTFNRFDNDTTELFTQPQRMTGTVFTGADFTPIKNVKLSAFYERASFRGYNVDFIGGGAALKF